MNTRAITNDISVGGQPKESDIQELQAKGFRTIVNLRTASDEGYVADEEHQVESRGLTYAAIPVSPKLLDDLAVQRFTGAVTSVDGPPAYVHCGSGGRAGLLTLLHLAVQNGWTVEQTLETGKKLDIAPSETSPYRAFFEDYIRRHSAGERA